MNDADLTRLTRAELIELRNTAEGVLEFNAVDDELMRRGKLVYRLTTIDAKGRANGHLGLHYDTIEDAMDVAAGSNPDRWGHLGDWRELCPASVKALRIDTVTQRTGELLASESFLHYR